MRSINWATVVTLLTSLASSTSGVLASRVIGVQSRFTS